MLSAAPRTGAAPATGAAPTTGAAPGGDEDELEFGITAFEGETDEAIGEAMIPIDGDAALEAEFGALAPKGGAALETPMAGMAG